MFKRACVYDKGLERAGRPGDGFYANPIVDTVATAGNLTIALAAILGGVAMFTGAAGAVAYTTPTAAELIAAMPEMDIGDSYTFVISNTAAQAATVTGGTDVTVSGIPVVNARSAICVLTKTSGTTMDLVVL